MGAKHLILSVKTGNVSPQYHVDVDNYFGTSKWTDFMPKSERQVNARLVRRPEIETPDLDPRPRLSATDLLNAPTGRDQNGQYSVETAETMEAETSEIVEEELTRFATEPELEDINENQAEETYEETVERGPEIYRSAF